jgi:7-carboxy-7-deazaguanine synthase
MSYQVKEIFYTLQGEGGNAGRPAVFCRFAGCNLWSGREQDRSTAVCQFCDTDFVGVDGTLGGKYLSAQLLAEQISNQWPNASHAHRLVVLTGGEPLLQVDSALLEALHSKGFSVAVESNGTIAAPTSACGGIDWLCISPKAGSTLVQKTGQELKVVWPQAGTDLDALAKLDFTHHFLQPMDNLDPVRNKQNTKDCIAMCMQNPKWRLSVQTHKVTGIR